MVYKDLNCLRCNQNIIKISLCLQILGKILRTEFHKYPSVSLRYTRGWTDGRTDMMTAVGVFRLVSVTFPRIAASWIPFSIAHSLCTVKHYNLKEERLHWSSKQFSSLEVFVLHFLHISISFTFASPRHKTMTRILRCYKPGRECNNSLRALFWQYFWTQRRADILNYWEVRRTHAARWTSVFGKRLLFVTHSKYVSSSLRRLFCWMICTKMMVTRKYRALLNKERQVPLCCHSSHKPHPDGENFVSKKQW